MTGARHTPPAMMYPYLQVALGAAIGGVGRFAVYRAVPPHWGSFGIATMMVNVAGSFVMGLLAALMAHRIGNAWAPFLMTGSLGGFTTFSAFSLDVLSMWERGHMLAASLYIVGSVTLSLLAVIAGLTLGRGLWA